MAEAIADTASTAAPITEALARAAAAQGRAIAAGSDDSVPSSDALDRSLDLLAEHGYEPRPVGADRPAHQLPVPPPWPAVTPTSSAT